MAGVKPCLIQFFRRSEGATAVEFAIVLPLLLSLIFGCIEFSLYLYNRQMMTHACREAARVGVVMRPAPRTTSVIDQDVTDRFNAILSSARLITFGESVMPTPQISYALGDDSAVSFGDSLTVQADFVYDFLFLSTLGIGPITIHGFSEISNSR